MLPLKTIAVLAATLPPLQASAQDTGYRVEALTACDTICDGPGGRSIRLPRSDAIHSGGLIARGSGGEADLSGSLLDLGPTARLGLAVRPGCGRSLPAEWGTGPSGDLLIVRIGWFSSGVDAAPCADPDFTRLVVIGLPHRGRPCLLAALDANASSPTQNAVARDIGAGAWHCGPP